MATFSICTGRLVSFSVKAMRASNSALQVRPGPMIDTSALPLASATRIRFATYSQVALLERFVFRAMMSCLSVARMMRVAS